MGAQDLSHPALCRQVALQRPVTRNPYAGTLRNYPNKVIEGKRKAKRKRAQRKRDAQRNVLPE
jgi:hypothetical protein